MAESLRFGRLELDPDAVETVRRTDINLDGMCRLRR
jgi:hypothetical protein